MSLCLPALLTFMAPNVEAGGGNLSAADYVELQQLYSASTRLIGEGDAAGWVELFAPDGVFSLPAIERFQAPALELRGHPALEKYVRDVISGAFNEAMGLPAEAKKRYLTTNVVLAPDGENRARGSAYMVMLLVGGDGPRVLGTGVYEDRFVKTPDGWKIAHRHLEPDV